MSYAPPACDSRDVPRDGEEPAAKTLGRDWCGTPGILLYFPFPRDSANFPVPLQTLYSRNRRDSSAPITTASRTVTVSLFYYYFRPGRLFVGDCFPSARARRLYSPACRHIYIYIHTDGPTETNVRLPSNRFVSSVKPTGRVNR